MHRFHDKVAVNVGSKTHYFSVKHAKHLAKAIRMAAEDVDVRPDFCTSTFPTFYLEDEAK